VPEKRPRPNLRPTTERSIRDERTEGRTNWKRLDALSDGAIRKAVASDSDAAPIAGADWFRRAKIVLPQPKKAVSIRLDRDVTEWFRRQGRGYQTRINAVLRAYVRAQQ
jgi:uncharacterized protein (DUF4415 family)